MTEIVIAAAGHPLRQKVPMQDVKEERFRRWRAPVRVHLPLTAVLKMLLTGLGLGIVFFIGTFGWVDPHRTAGYHAPPRFAAAGHGRDPYVEARMSRVILERQAGPPDSAH